MILMKAFHISALEPLIIGNIAVSQGFDLKLSDVKAFGITGFKVDKIRFNYEKFKVGDDVE